MNRTFISCIFLLIMVLKSETSRVEAYSGFIQTDPPSFQKVTGKLVEIDARNDIPEMFEQKFSMKEKTNNDSTLQDINGFRIQIFKTEDLSEAKRREAMYINNFGEDNLILIFEPPFYKIRVGRLRNRDEADEFQEALRNRGFNNTIIVPDLVKVLMPVEIK